MGAWKGKLLTVAVYAVGLWLVVIVVVLLVTSWSNGPKINPDCPPTAYPENC